MKIIAKSLYEQQLVNLINSRKNKANHSIKNNQINNKIIGIIYGRNFFIKTRSKDTMRRIKSKRIELIIGIMGFIIGIIEIIQTKKN